MGEGSGRGLYVYGVVGAGADATPLPDLTGVGGAALDLVVSNELAAVVSPVSLDLRTGRRAELLSHSEVLNAVAAQREVIPVQFGTVMLDEHEVVSELLEAQESWLRHLLDHLADAVQLNLRATYVEERVLAEIVRRSPRIAALRERTRSLPEGVLHPDSVQLGRLVSDEMEATRADDRESLVQSVVPLAREVFLRDRADVATVVDLALLVGRRSVADVEARLEAIAEDVHERIRMSLTGPLAPFDFVREESWV
jgi:hypothetical protein